MSLKMKRSLRRIGWVVLVLVGVYGLVLGAGPLLHEALSAAQDLQRVFHDRMTQVFMRMQEAPSPAATAALIWIGFLYGVFHAVGPGHGKVVVTGYLLASQSCLRRGIAITFLSALMQAVVAIALVYGLIVLFGFSRGSAQVAAGHLETVSLGLMAVIGVGLAARGLRALRRLYFPVQTAGCCGGHHHHDHHHDESSSCGCGCQGHAPDAAAVEKADNLWSQGLMVVSIGIRPCSGALLLLIFASLLGLYGAGAWATLAMGLGTALTTSALAVATVLLRDRAVRMMDQATRRLDLWQAWLGVAGGALLIFMGGVFLVAGLSAPLEAGVGGPIQSEAQHPLMKSFYQK